jgi:prepilin-type processing-associated H-X9-DG protein
METAMNKLTTLLFGSLLLSAPVFASPIPSTGLVGWWRAEGDALDSAGTNHGVAADGVSFVPGKVGKAFLFNAAKAGILVPASPSLNVGAGSGFTLEAWINPSDVTQRHPLFEWNYSGNAWGVHFYIDPISHSGPGALYANIVDTGGGWNQIYSGAGAVTTNQFQHVALTYDKASGVGTLYCNGTVVARQVLGNFTPQTTYDLYLGRRPATSGETYSFAGLLDEAAIFNRALTASEILAIYRTGKHTATLSIPPGELSFREIRYDGKLSDDEAQFTVDIEAEATGKGESMAELFEGDVAVPPARLSDQLKIIRQGNRYLLAATHAGRFRFKLDLVARIQRAEPWNQISFTGPAAAIASVAAQANGAGMEVQLLSGTLLESDKTNGVSRVKGFLGADQTVALRWQGKISEVTRKALLTADSTLNVQATPAVLKYTSQFHYDIVQGNVAQLTLVVPSTQALTRLVGEQIRDWHSVTEGDRQVLTIEFIKPVDKAYDLTLFSEQTVEGIPVSGTGLSLNPPQPLGVERESGSLTLSAEDTVVEIESLAGLRQVNAPAEALAAYRFNGRPFALALKLKPIEPVINVADRVSARLEETRLIVSHGLSLSVEKAGIYAVELSPQPGFMVADVLGDGIEDWKVNEGKLRVNFSARALGSRMLEVLLEQALKSFPSHISISPLRVTGAAREPTQIGAASAPGIRLRTAELTGLREIPVRTLQSKAGGTPALPSDELLAYAAEQPDWSLSLTSERLAARVVADVFNLVTIGDGIAGGSATIRYGLLNQGVQEYRVKLPAQCKNVEFTGPNIRRKELAGRGSSAEGRAPDNSSDTNSVIWTIGLQDKVWGGYTLVVTYDYPFDPGGATLAVGGLHPLDAERETGSVAITTAASLQLSANTVSDTLRRIDESELSPADRGLIARAVVLAYQYTGSQYDLTVDVKHYEQERVLEAVADRTQITSVLSEAGEMLTQASFMVKNNEKQFQRFLLPKGAKLWGCYVNGQPAKPECDGDWVLVSLPRDANRDQAFAVDIMYAEKKSSLASHWAQSLELTAPRTDVPNTYAEWQVYVPPSLRVSHFGGNMNVAQGTTYDLLDAWGKFLGFYVQVLREAGAAILVIGALALLVIALVISAVRRGWNGIITLLVVVTILAVLGAMLLPALSAAKSKSQRISSANNLKQIGVAIRLFGGDNNERLPVSFEEMKNELGTDKITYDPETGQRYTYVGGGMSLDSLKPDSVLVYSSLVNGHCSVLFADGHAETMTAARFGELSQRGLVQVATAGEIAQQQQRQAVMNSQFQGRGGAQPERADSLMVARGVTPLSPVAQPPAETRTADIAGSVGVAAGLPVLAAAPAPAVAGIHSIRIELPQTGQPFLFTKVLNIRDEPLSIRARIMSLRTFQNIQMAWQVAVFVLGLILWWRHWSRRRGMRPSSFMLTLALALMIGSVGSLLIQWRALHDALIVGFPVVTLAIIAFLIWKYWPRHSLPEPEGSTPPEPPHLDSTPPPATVCIAVLFALSLCGASAAESPIRNPQSAIGNATIVSARYSGTVNERVALLDAVLRFSATEAGQVLPLFGGDVALQQFGTKSGDAEPVRNGNNIAVRFGSRGEATVELKMLVKVAGDVSRRRLLFGIPPALSSDVAFVLDQPEADVEFPTAVAFKRELEKDRTRVEGVIGSADHVELFWTPRMKRAAEVAPTIFCQNLSTVRFGGGVAIVRTRLDYQITQGELRQARVQLPRGQRLLRVEGLSIRNWEVKDENGAPVLVVDLLKGISPVWRLTVETEKVLEAMPSSASIELPHPLEVKRETGLVALQSAEELGLSVESASELQRVDVEEFGRATAAKTDGLLSVFRFAKPEFNLRVRIETVQPQIEAVVRNHVRVGTDQVTLSAAIDYTIKRAGVFALKVALPEGYRIEQVTGRNILQWTEQTAGDSARGSGGEAGTRILEVTLKERTSGACSLNLELTRSLSQLPRSLPIAGVHPIDTVKLTGFVAVSTEPGVAAKTEWFDGLTEIPAVSLPDYTALAAAGNVLAYKFISSEPKPAPEWKLNVATETIEAWVRAETVNTITLAETLVTGRALVRYDIGNAPVKEFGLKVPAAFRNVEITGPNIRSKELTGRRSKAEDREAENAPGACHSSLDTNYVLWRVELQNKTRGFYTLVVTWEQPRPSRANTVEITGVSAHSVERETGLIVIAAKTGLQVRELSAVDLQRVDRNDLPDWAGRPDDTTALSYHFVRPDYKLVLEARRFEEAEVLQALVDSARLATVVADDGQTMTAMTLSVRNNGRQFLELELPPGATVWSAFVAGQPVRPSQRKGKLLLPIAQSGADEGGLSVELTYVGTNLFPRARGQVAFDSPKFDVPLKNAQWELFLPPDYDYGDFRGSMTPEVAAPPSSSLMFSLLDYTRMERASQASAKADVERDVSYAEQNLSGGKMREAVASFNRAKAGAAYSKDQEAGVKELEKKLKTAQASNLIIAQNEFSLRNAGQNAQMNAPAPAQSPGMQYDNSSAEQQWTKLQQAQEIVVAKVQPLHVNLPLRGQRYAFNQVLQTETGKSMTIRLLAASTRAVSWPKRAAATLTGFLVLWGLVVFALRIARRRA